MARGELQASAWKNARASLDSASAPGLSAVAGLHAEHHPVGLVLELCHLARRQEAVEINGIFKLYCGAKVGPR